VSQVLKVQLVLLVKRAPTGQKVKLEPQVKMVRPVLRELQGLLVPKVLLESVSMVPPALSVVSALQVQRVFQVLVGLVLLVLQVPQVRPGHGVEKEILGRQVPLEQELQELLAQQVPQVVLAHVLM